MSFRLRMLLLCFWAAAQGHTSIAQVGLYLPTYSNMSPGLVLNFPVRVLNFDSIVSAQFVIDWDPAVLQFQEVGAYGLPDLDADNFGLTEALDSGLIRFVWWHLGNGVSRPDSAAIFNIKLKVIGSIPSSSTVEFTERAPNTFFEIVNAAGQFFDLQNAQIFNGLVTVGFPVSATEPEPATWTAGVQPNPVTAESRLWLELPETTEIEYFLSDLSGQIIFRKNLTLSAGKHGMEIANPLSEHVGLYFLTVRSASTVKVFPLLFF